MSESVRQSHCSHAHCTDSWKEKTSHESALRSTDLPHPAKLVIKKGSVILLESTMWKAFFHKEDRVREGDGILLSATKSPKKCVACEKGYINGIRPKFFFARGKFWNLELRESVEKVCKSSSTQNERLTPGEPLPDSPQIFPKAMTSVSCSANKIGETSDTFLCYLLKVFEVSSPMFLQILLLGAILMYSSVRRLGVFC